MNDSLPTLGLLAGFGLPAVAVTTHLEATGPNCDGCAPFHHLFVLAPLAVGAVVLAGSGYALARRRGTV